MMKTLTASMLTVALLPLVAITQVAAEPASADQAAVDAASADPALPSDEELRQRFMGEDGRPDREAMRSYFESLSPEERAQWEQRRTLRMAQMMAFRDSLSAEEREARRADRETRRGEFRAEAETIWSTLSAAEQESYLAEARERAEEGPMGGRFGGRGKAADSD